MWAVAVDPVRFTSLSARFFWKSHRLCKCFQCGSAAWVAVCRIPYRQMCLIHDSSYFQFFSHHLWCNCQSTIKMHVSSVCTLTLLIAVIYQFRFVQRMTSLNMVSSFLPFTKILLFFVTICATSLVTNGVLLVPGWVRILPVYFNNNIYLRVPARIESIYKFS